MLNGMRCISCMHWRCFCCQWLTALPVHYTVCTPVCNFSLQWTWTIQ